MGALLILSTASSGVQATWAQPNAPARASGGIRFVVEPARNRLRIVAPGYELSLSRRNGALLSLLERDNGARLVTSNGCLWGARGDGNGDYIGGCSFTPRGANRFSYRWDQRSATLTLTYAADPSASRSVGARVALTAHDTYFDLRLALDNHYRRVIPSVVFPADLLGASATVSAGYAPTFLPGVRVAPRFFTGGRDDVETYPSRYAFADYLALDLAGGHLALYSVNPAPSALQPVDLGFVRGLPPSPCSGPTFCIAHSFDTWIADGAKWTSPVIRVRVGETVDRTILDYRVDNAIDAYPSVADKLGADLATYAQAPVIKADARKKLPPLADWGPDLRRLPSPAVLHPVRLQPGAHDENAPDFLPLDTAVGTTADLRSMVDEAHALGLLVMPYLNVSWWNLTSPTVQQLLTDENASEFAVLNAAGDPVIEDYAPFKGYLVSPYSATVQKRVASLMDQWQAAAPTDCYFFDQIGARTWRRDFNAAEPDPLAYDDGWLSLLAPYASRCLMAEDGWDRMAQSFAGFQGGLLLLERTNAIPDAIYGAGNWQPYPLALWLFHDKVLFYQHDLYEGTMTTDPEVLTWNVAYGFMLSYSWDGTADTLDSPWLDVVGSFQRALGPYYAAQPLKAYTSPAPNVTKTDFPNLSVVANWNQTDAYATDGYGIAPTGFLARSADGAVVAGSFSGTFDGTPLSPGTHDLIVSRTASAITVHQPLGADTQIAVALPQSWPTGRSVQAVALAADGRPLRPVEGTIQEGRFVFTCAGPSPGAPAPTYRIDVG